LLVTKTITIIITYVHRGGHVGRYGERVRGDVDATTVVGVVVVGKMPVSLSRRNDY